MKIIKLNGYEIIVSRYGENKQPLLIQPTSFFEGLNIQQAINKLLDYEKMVKSNRTPGQRLSKRDLKAQWITCSRIYGFNLRLTQASVRSIFEKPSQHFNKLK